MPAGFDIGAAIADIWAAAKQAGPFGCMLVLALLVRSERKHDATRRELATLHAVRAEELKKAASIAEDNVAGQQAILSMLTGNGPRRRGR